MYLYTGMGAGKQCLPNRPNSLRLRGRSCSPRRRTPAQGGRGRDITSDQPRAPLTVEVKLRLKNSNGDSARFPERRATSPVTRSKIPARRVAWKPAKNWTSAVGSPAASRPACCSSGVHFPEGNPLARVRFGFRDFGLAYRDGTRGVIGHSFMLGVAVPEQRRRYRPEPHKPHARTTAAYEPEATARLSASSTVSRYTLMRRIVQAKPELIRA